ncbi:hypothetical protein GCM10010833_23460 [Blastomonas aquatica]|uniref:Phospholipase D-like domain-containing protein n=1 Tax=Blastomonas aquatica TaxID=1510276 RepID=A0ABQ1JFL0_9SPHN|nr:hypothetical protein GCM10010833_23460 [Blastomonas aquatica]
MGLSRGGCNCKLHALAGGDGRPLRFLLTSGNIAACCASDPLFDNFELRTIILARMAHDSNAIRDLIERLGAAPNIPSKAKRHWRTCSSRPLCEGRNAVECIFCRLKDFRRMPPDATDSPSISSALSISRLPSHSGCEP